MSRCPLGKKKRKGGLPNISDRSTEKKTKSPEGRRKSAAARPPRARSEPAQKKKKRKRGGGALPIDWLLSNLYSKKSLMGGGKSRMGCSCHLIQRKGESLLASAAGGVEYFEKAGGGRVWEDAASPASRSGGKKGNKYRVHLLTPYACQEEEKRGNLAGFHILLAAI